MEQGHGLVFLVCKNAWETGESPGQVLVAEGALLPGGTQQKGQELPARLIFFFLRLRGVLTKCRDKLD